MRIDWWRQGRSLLRGAPAIGLLLFAAVAVQGSAVEVPPDWRPLSEIAKTEGCEHIVAEKGEKKNQLEAVMFGEGTAMFIGESAHFLFDGIKVDLPKKVAQASDTHEILIDPLWWESYVWPLFQNRQWLAKERPVVFLDPGHGGKQPGASNKELSLIEKELNLEVSLRLKELMEQAGWKVVLSREKDEELSLPGRSELANRSGAEIFISIHFNAALNPEAQGLETYVLVPASEPLPGNGQDAQNLQLAWALQKSLVDSMKWKDRGVRRARFMVLRDLQIPGVLVELGFISNEQEAGLIGKEETRQQLAQALWQGLQSIQQRK